MTHVHSHPFEHPFDRLFESWVPGDVVVAIYRLYWGDELELLEDVIATYISRVQDQVNTSERVVYAGTEETVRVGDQSNEIRHVRNELIFK
jgi:hypothetical protein